MCREVWKYFAELEAVCIISFAVLVWSLQVLDNVLCVLWCLCVGQCQNTYLHMVVDGNSKLCLLAKCWNDY